MTLRVQSTTLLPFQRVLRRRFKLCADLTTMCLDSIQHFAITVSNLRCLRLRGVAELEVKSFFLGQKLTPYSSSTT